MPLILAVRKYPASPLPAAVRIERGEIAIGRGAGAGLLLDDPSVSRRHCTFAGEGQVWHLTDSSTGGTFVNGQRLGAPHVVRHGDVIAVGGCEIVAMLQDVAQAAPVQAASARDGWGRPPAGSTAVPAGWPAPAGQPAGAGGDAVSVLLQAAGLARGQIAAPDAQVLATCGAVLRAAIAGLAAQAADRTKARADLGIAAAGEGAMTGEALLAGLLTLPPAEAQARVAAMTAAIDAHQRALPAALQASLHHALDQFAPAAIKSNARGDAAAWQAYERAFTARDGFVEVFAQAFAQHYAEAAKG